MCALFGPVAYGELITSNGMKRKEVGDDSLRTKRKFVDDED